MRGCKVLSGRGKRNPWEDGSGLGLETPLGKREAKRKVLIGNQPQIRQEGGKGNWARLLKIPQEEGERAALGRRTREARRSAELDLVCASSSGSHLKSYAPLSEMQVLAFESCLVNSTGATIGGWVPGEATSLTRL